MCDLVRTTQTTVGPGLSLLVFGVKTLVDTNVSEEHAASIFMVVNETVCCSNTLVST